MDTNSQRQDGRDNRLSSLNVTIEALKLAQDACCIAPARAVFGSVGTLLTMIRVCSFLFHGEELQAHMYPGLDDQ